ncbi:PREDICTED: uncharacterized protein LOC108563059, partial [Nicrophorus vespilloides]|uniref:Uncharacterized protein LOC108563059 n=1 Tax=Nicrophorus vespilloides TaxID=110193 RepID=A0ABM1MRA7_NICVS
REATQRDADRERRLRADSESRAKLALQEAARNRSRLKLEIARMEETVLSMLTYKKQSEQLRQEKAALTIAFENRCQQYQNTITRLNQEIFSLRQQIEQSCNNLENSTATQALLMQKQAEESRKQYERCLDDVANQVVRALVTQKGLKEEVAVLNSRIQDLEAQNCTLTSMLVHQLNDPPNHLALEDSHSEDNNTSADASPSNLMRSSLTFRHCNSFDSDILDSKGELKSKDPGLSLEDKKRHHVLTKLWTELKGTEVTPKRLIEALSAVDSALWIPPQRPVSLNLQLPILQASKYRRSKPILAQSKSEEETGNESPESGNRDEGYSTMSSDVQAEVTRTGGVGDSQLEDLKEEDVETRLLASENNNKDPEVIYIPINLLNNLKPRNSFPPGKDLLPFQHIMRSFSDSHLCIKITTAPSPCYTFSSPISSSPSILLLDLSDKSINPLRRTKATSLLVDGEKNESPGSWSSFADERVECSTMDAEYIQHWLKLDDTRSNLQQQHRDLFELEYDHNELEDWSLNISNELDSTRLEHWKKSQTGDAITPGQISQISTLPSIQENNAFELEEDSSEILWNESSYMVGQDVVTLLMDGEKQWPYATSSNIHHSPDSSWSSASDCCNSQNDPSSKRSSAVLSGCCSDDTGELPAIETYFTRDYYRLVKFESTKSLASSSSRSLGGGGCGGGALSENGERETALQNVLTFIAEQQKYTRETKPMEAVATKEFNIEAPPPQAVDDIKVTCDVQQPKIAYADEVCLVTPIDIIESESCSMLSEHPVDICSSINVELSSTEYQKDSELSESLTSSVSTPETIVSKIPRRKSSKIPISPAKSLKQGGAKGASRIPHRTAKPKPEIKVKSPEHQKQQQQSAITSERLPQSTSGVVSDIIDGPPHRAVSFHERATSKDVIDELNRMIKNGNDASQEHLDVTTTCLDEACRATGWIHVERDVDLTDPKVRADLCDVMLTSVSSDSSPTSSCGGSVSSESTEEPPDYGQLHRIHRYHRQKKANAARPELAVVRASAPSFRPSIIGRPDFYVRYGEKEREAVASFDFLDDFSTSGSCSGSMDEQVVVIQKQQQQHNHQHHNKQQQIGD